jgi:hypothetical protein
MAVVMSVHVFSGLGLSCANEALRPFRGLGVDPVALGIASAGHDSGEVYATDGVAAESKGGTSRCCCKKQKKCPVIPRAAITSNPTHRFHEGPSQAKAASCHYLVAELTDYRFSGRNDKPLVEFAWCAPFFCANPLALSSVLLI